MGRRLAWMVALAVVGHGVLGCATRTIDTGLDASDQVLLAATSVGDQTIAGCEGSSVDAAELQQALAKIDAGIEAKKDKPLVVNALRVRKGLLLASTGHPSMADDEFNQVDRGQLSSQRDRALYDIHDAFIFWCGVANRTLVPSDFALFDDHLASLAAAGDAIQPEGGRPPKIHYLVEQMRVRMALRAARPGGSRAPGYITDGIGRYGQSFDVTDQAGIRSLCRAQTTEVDPADVVWLAWAPEAVKEGQKSWEVLERADPAPVPDWWAGMPECH